MSNKTNYFNKSDSDSEDNDNDNDSDYEEDDDPEHKLYVDCLNIGHVYFKQVFRKTKEHMFEGINIEDECSTNRALEYIYASIYTYKLNLTENNALCDVYDVNSLNNYLEESEYDELYGLSLNNHMTKVSPSLFSIITYIAHNIDWKNPDTEWSIIPLKNLNH